MYCSGLAEVAGAIGNGPLAALGEEVEKTEIVSKRKRTLVESLDAQEKEEGRIKEPKICPAGQNEKKEELPETIPEQNMEASLEEKIGPSLEEKMEPSLEEKMEPSLGEKMEPSLEEKIEPSLEEKIEPSLEEKIEPSLEQKTEPVTPGKDKVLTRLSPTSGRQVSTESSLVATDCLVITMLPLQVRHESPEKPSPAPNVVLANLTDSAALVVGTMAKNIMEGGAAIFGQLLRAQLQVLCNDGDVYRCLRPLKFLRKYTVSAFLATP